MTKKSIGIQIVTFRIFRNIFLFDYTFTYINDVSSFVALDNIDLATKVKTRAALDYDQSFSKETKEFLIEATDKDILIENKRVLFYDPLNWVEIDPFAKFWAESSVFEEEVVAVSPIDLEVKYETEGDISSIYTFSDYGVVLITKVHSYRVDFKDLRLTYPGEGVEKYDNFSCFSIPAEAIYQAGTINGLCLSRSDIIVK